MWISRLTNLYSRHPELVQIPRLESGERAAFSKWVKKYKPDVLIGFASLNVVARDPRVSGANENDFLIGKTALDMVVGMIHRGERGVPEVPIRTLVDSTWIPGQTLRRQEAGPTGKAGAGSRPRKSRNTSAPRK